MRILLVLFLFLYSIVSISAFNDVSDNWYKTEILSLKDEGIINGYDDGTFLPRDTVSRAELLKIIMKTSKSEVYETPFACFTDVDNSQWYAKYICSASEQGITKGYADGTFKPGGSITLIETLALGFRAFETDVNDAPGDWFVKYQKYADTHNIIATHSYTVNRLVSRGQAAYIIDRISRHMDGESLNDNSAGCSLDSVLDSGSFTIDINGVERKYLLYVPSNYRAGNPSGLVFAFHGRTNNNEMVRDYMQLGGGSYGTQQKDFIVVYPQGAGAGPYSWSQESNVELFDGLLIYISENTCIDRDAIFSVGHSLGSYMSNKISCRRGDVIRAMTGVASDGFRGACTGPVSSLITHLPGDHLASYSGGQRAFGIRSDVNLCSSDESDMRIGDIRSCTQKTSCTEGNTAIFCNEYATYGNDQHSWPKEGNDDILNFFKNINDY